VAGQKVSTLEAQIAAVGKQLADERAKNQVTSSIPTGPKAPPVILNNGKNTRMDNVRTFGAGPGIENNGEGLMLRNYLGFNRGPSPLAHDRPRATP
jgi:hypothetical protein